jgi:hypothetical protein
MMAMICTRRASRVRPCRQLMKMQGWNLKSWTFHSLPFDEDAELESYVIDLSFVASICWSIDEDAELESYVIDFLFFARICCPLMRM